MARWHSHTEFITHSRWDPYVSGVYLEVSTQMVTMTICHFTWKIKYSFCLRRSFVATLIGRRCNADASAHQRIHSQFLFSRTYLNRTKVHRDLWIQRKKRRTKGKGRKNKMESETSSTTSLLSARCVRLNRRIASKCRMTLAFTRETDKTLAIKAARAHEKRENNIYTVSFGRRAVECVHDQNAAPQPFVGAPNDTT